MANPRFGIPSPGKMGRERRLWILIIKLLQENFFLFLEHIMRFHLLSSMKGMVTTWFLFDYERLIERLLNKLRNLISLGHHCRIQFIIYGLRLPSFMHIFVKPIFVVGVVISALQVKGYQITWSIFRVKPPQF